MHKERTGPHGEFFPVSKDVIRKIIEAGGRSEHVLAYMVFQRHVTNRLQSGSQLTTAGVHALTQKLGIGRGEAAMVVDWLSKPGEEPFITPIDVTLADTTKTRRSAPSAPRWAVLQGGDEINLPNALVDGIGRGKEKPPLVRLREEVQLRPDLGIGLKDIRLDVVMVLASVYKVHDVGRCGGVDPLSAVYRQWSTADEVVDSDSAYSDREPDTEISGTWARFVEIERDGDFIINPEFRHSALFYVTDDILNKRRFECALHNLKRLGHVYEVITVWERLPDESSTADEYLYPLYVCDTIQRLREPALQRAVNKLGFEAGLLCSHNEFSEHQDDGTKALKSGQHRAIFGIDTEQCAIGVLRLRYRAGDSDYANGMQAEQSRVNRWEEVLISLAADVKAGFHQDRPVEQSSPIPPVEPWTFMNSV